MLLALTVLTLWETFFFQARATDVMYTVKDKSSVSIEGGTAPEGSSATFSSNGSTAQRLTKGTGQTLTLTGYNGYKITKLTLSMKSNSSGGAGSLTYSTDGGSSYTTIVSDSKFNSSSWYGSWSSSDYVYVEKDVNITCGASNVIFKLESTENSLYCLSYKLTYEENETPLGPTTPTISVSDAEIAWGKTFTVDDSGITGGDITVSSGNTSIATVDGLEITPVACGEVEITVSTAEDETYESGSETFTLTITAPTGSATMPEQVVFYESFDDCDDQGGNDNLWSGSVADGTFSADNTWTTSYASGANACAKFGTSTLGGSATTPGIDLEADVVYTLTFKAGAWNGNTEGTYLSLSATNASIRNEANTAAASFVTLTKGAWTAYTLRVIVTDASAPATISFSTDGGNKRFFLDEVTVSRETDPTATVRLNRYGYATYCSVLPIDFSTTEGYTAWRVNSIDADGTIHFRRITEKIWGGQGVLLYNQDADGEHTSDVTVRFANGTTVFDNEDSDDANDNLLVGTTAPTFVAASAVYGLAGNRFVMSSADGNIGANKAYIPAGCIPAEVKEFSFVFEDENDGINAVNAEGLFDERSSKPERMVNGSIWNVAGQRIQRMQRGINIVKQGSAKANGKKIIVR